MAAAAIPWIIAGISAMGAISQANSEARNQKSTAAAMDYNSAVARQQAQSSLSESTSAQLAQNRKAREALGQQRAAAAQAGVGFGGTTGDLLERSETLAELDQLNLAYEGAMKARGYTSQAELDAFNATVARQNAKGAKLKGLFGAATAFASPVLSTWGPKPTTTTTTPKTNFSPYSLGSGTSSVGLRAAGGVGLRYN